MSGNYIDKHPLEKEAIDTILNIGDEFNNSIPEDIFVKRYLPMLANKTGNTPLTEWLNVAGHIYAEVNIIDKDGNIIFKVPSIFKRLKTKEHKYAHQSVHEIIETSKLHSINSPNKGEHMMEEGLKTTLPDPINSTDEDERWNAILARYGYVVNAENPSTPSVEVKKEDKSFDGYDIA